MLSTTLMTLSSLNSLPHPPPLLFAIPPSPLFLTGELGIFCPFMTPSHKPHLALSKSKRLIKVTSATAGDTEKGTGMASGVLCLVRALILHELDRITAWGEECLSAVPEQTRFVYQFSIIFVIFRVIKIIMIYYCYAYLPLFYHMLLYRQEGIILYRSIRIYG